MTRYDSPVAMPTVQVESRSYIEGCLSAMIGDPLETNPYVPAEGEYDYTEWIRGWKDTKEVDDRYWGANE